MEKITPTTCKKYGKRKVLPGFQYKNIWFRCKDRRNCETCQNTYVFASGRYNSVKTALEDGCRIYTMDADQWNTVKKQADRDGLDGNYVRITSENKVVYFIADIPKHDLVTEIDKRGIDWKRLISHSLGRSQFKGKYSIKAEEENKEEPVVVETVELKSYFPVFKYRDTKIYVPDTAVEPQAVHMLYLNPKWQILNEQKGQEFLKWRACVIAESMIYMHPEWEFSHMTEEAVVVPKAELESGAYITNYRIAFLGSSGIEIKDLAHKRLIELQLGITEPSIPFEKYKIDTFSPEFTDGTVEPRKTDYELEFNLVMDGTEGKVSNGK